MARAAVAIASKIHGKVTATNAKCEVRILKEGDVVHEGEVVKAADGGKVHLELGDGSTKQIAENQNITLNDEVLAASAPDAMNSAIMSDGATIKNVIDAINSGKGLDDLLQATASGLTNGNNTVIASDGGKSFVMLTNAVDTAAADAAAAKAAADAAAAHAAADAAAAQAAADAAAAQAAAAAAAAQAVAVAAAAQAVADAAAAQAAAAAAAQTVADAAAAQAAADAAAGVAEAAALAAAADAAQAVAAAQAAATLAANVQTAATAIDTAQGHLTTATTTLSTDQSALSSLNTAAHNADTYAATILSAATTVNNALNTLATANSTLTSLSTATSHTVSSYQSDLQADLAGNTTTTGMLQVGSYATGQMGITGDHDWYRIDLVAGQQYVFQLDGVDIASTSMGRMPDAYLYLRDASGNYVTHNDDSGGNMNSIIFHTASVTGTYYLDAGAYNNYYQGDYQLTARTAAQYNQGFAATPSAQDAAAIAASLDVIAAHAAADYHAALDQAAAAHVAAAQGSTATFHQPDLQVDLASNITTRGMLQVGTFADGQMGTVGDHDWYRIDLVAGQQYVFQLDGVDIASTSMGRLPDAYLYLRDANGNVVTYNDDSGGNMNSIIFHTATVTGTYYLDAGAWVDRYQGDYHLTARTADQYNQGFAAAPAAQDAAAWAAILDNVATQALATSIAATAQAADAHAAIGGATAQEIATAQDAVTNATTALHNAEATLAGLTVDPNDSTFTHDTANAAVAAANAAATAAHQAVDATGLDASHLQGKIDGADATAVSNATAELSHANATLAGLTVDPTDSTFTHATAAAVVLDANNAATTAHGVATTAIHSAETAITTAHNTEVAAHVATDAAIAAHVPVASLSFHDLVAVNSDPLYGLVTAAVVGAAEAALSVSVSVEPDLVAMTEHIAALVQNLNNSSTTV